jgi:hypothetical protein
MKKIEDGGSGVVGRIADFDQRFGLVLFRRIKLCIARAQRAGLIEIAAQGLLLDVVLKEPNLGAVVRLVIPQDEPDERLVGAEGDLVVKLVGHGTQFFEKGDADGFDVAGLVGIPPGVRLRRFAADARDYAVEAHGSEASTRLGPLGSAEKNADAAVVNGKDQGRTGICFNVPLDGANDDAVVSDIDDYASRGKIGNDLILGAGICRSE